MFCSKCGNAIAEDGSYCSICGTPVKSNTMGTVESYVDLRVKKFAKSPLLIATAIIFSLAVVSPFLESRLDGLFGNILSGSFLYYFMYSIFGDILRDITSAVSMLDYFLGIDNSLITTILSDLPNALICIGLWITVISALNTDKPFVTKGGISLISVIFALKMVGVFILEVLLIIIILKPAIEYQGVLLAVEFILVLAVLPITIAICKSFGKTLGSIQHAIEGGLSSHRDISTFVIIYFFVTGTFGLFGNILTGASSILLGIVLYKFREELKIIDFTAYKMVTNPENVSDNESQI
ncbi:MAG: zinc ribbon domain-containing protein [Ruminococcaceae bacterium]|nr:zinc ribbon domain-containing protein [Oscillospiraceae bacterium]